MNWKTRGRLAGLTLLTVSFVSANIGYSAGPARAGSGEPVIHAASIDAAPGDLARIHLTQFLDYSLNDNQALRSGVGMKVALEAGDGGTVSIWVTPIDTAEGRVMGRVADAPEGLSVVGEGDVVAFEQDQVQDWYFIGRNGRMYGNYTTRALLAGMSSGAAAQLRATLSLTPTPATW